MVRRKNRGNPDRAGQGGGKPSFRDPDTRVAVANACLVTIECGGVVLVRYWSEHEYTYPTVAAVMQARRRRERGGAL